MMGRVRANIVINGKEYWALFDTGSRNTYVTADVAKNLITFDMPYEEKVALGGKVHTIKKGCILICKVEGLPIHTHARIIEKLGKDEEGKEIKVLIGALTMQEWGIRPLPDEEKLDLSNYPKEFVEYL